ncbi:L-threonylcarbamoyladenylate synthase [Aurantiacibacter sp. MUD11]|uniref:L-threonylcarbamoyladenylate synthase n=1 Tax=Aurantiacibacter sp. MUD11 TaxID=3003265 RepID=UPI0022AA9FE8|nr:L-threonylcarbamoyladenylate synthase [Aurantiacibacter sp. MUD11]WAT17207.1 L-threonylcarbamoyladenylate synthase [Aurantiacibacter sp. MUD11]
MSDKQRLLPSDATGIAAAAAILREGGLVAIPTETVYGLAARADRAEAVANIYRTKGRPDFNPLIVHVASLEMARQLAVFDPRAEQLAVRYWPGPLTLVLPLREGAPIAAAVTAGLPTIALRQPGHPVAAALLAELNLPLAAPSANRSYGVSPTRPEHVLASFGEAAPPVLDGGACEAGLESTIVALRPDGSWALLRPGPIAQEELTEHLGPPEKLRGTTIEAPGQLEKHYSPGKPVRLHRAQPEDGDFMIGFGEVGGDVNLSPTGDLAEAASQLYAALHAAAQSDCPAISVAPVPQEGMGRAINDRLRRAAAS